MILVVKLLGTLETVFNSQPCIILYKSYKLCRAHYISKTGQSFLVLQASHASLFGGCINCNSFVKPTTDQNLSVIPLISGEKLYQQPLLELGQYYLVSACLFQR